MIPCKCKPRDAETPHIVTTFSECPIDGRSSETHECRSCCPCNEPGEKSYADRASDLEDAIGRLYNDLSRTTMPPIYNVARDAAFRSLEAMDECRKALREQEEKDDGKKRPASDAREHY